MPSKVVVHNSQRDVLISKKEIKGAVSFLLEKLNVATDEVVFHFVTEKKISALHQEFFDDPTPTDCITFPIDTPERKGEGPHLLGEVFVCPKVAKNYAAQHRLSVKEELLRYVVHGLLHLVGHEDTEPKKRAKMKRQESACLQALLCR